jgi:flagellar hook-associated protein 3 FlgL
MRVTEGHLAGRFLFDINRTRESIGTLQSSLASGKRVQKPSDDPQAADVIIRLKNTIGRYEQYGKNIEEGTTMLENAEAGLGDFSDVLMNMKALVTRANSGQSSEYSTYAAQIDSMLSQAVDIANTKFGGKFLFGGTNTLTQPFTLAADRSAVTANPAGITGAISVQVAESMTTSSNIDGAEAFQGTAIFQHIIAIRDSLSAGTLPTAAQMDAISTDMEYVSGKAAKAGAMLQGLQNLQSNLEQQQLRMTDLLSLQQDTDVAEATLKLKWNETMLDAALQVTAGVLPKTLVNYM